jgi:hypothetical protein
MLYQYPLEALARRRSTTDQHEFACAARRVLVDSDDALFEAHDHGLAIFAANEDAIAAPVQLLREMFGDFLDVRSPRVRLIPGNPPLEPIMHVRIITPTEFGPRICAELKARGVALMEQCVRGRTEVIRGEGPLQPLLGLTALLDRITEGKAAHTTRLVRYAPVWEPKRRVARPLRS